ncbi:MAG: hypothetical protein IJ214_07975 [Clostridia bacterium]|nr:hypothetical protein [Clostridia bacterium]
MRKPFIVLLICAILAASSSFALAENSFSAPSYFKENHDHICYDCPITIARLTEETIYSYAVTLLPMLSLPPSVFSDQSIIETERRLYNDESYPYYVDYYVLANDENVLLSSNGRVSYSTPVGAALRQLLRSYRDEFTPCQPDEYDMEPIQQMIHDISALLPGFPSLHHVQAAYRLTHEEAIAYAARFDQMYRESFTDTADKSLQKKLSGCEEDCLFVQLQYDYDGLCLGSNYYYMLPGSDRMIDIMPAVFIVCDGKIVDVQMDTIYSITQHLAEQSHIMGFEEAKNHFEEKMNEALLLKDWSVYAIELEACVSVTGSKQEDFRIQPVWHFSVIEKSRIENVKEKYLHAAYIQGAHHYIFNAESGEWINW